MAVEQLAARQVVALVSLGRCGFESRRSPHEERKTMKFTMDFEHQDVLGQTIKLGDVVVTLDSNYRSGGSFEVGVVVGSTAKMVKVATSRPSWRTKSGPEISNRHLDKILVVPEHSVRLQHLRDELSKTFTLIAEVQEED